MNLFHTFAAHSSRENFIIIIFNIVLFLRGMFTPKNTPNQGRCCPLTK
jgi:hypothetical protein